MSWHPTRLPVSTLLASVKSKNNYTCNNAAKLDEMVVWMLQAQTIINE